ncbi:MULTISPECIES: MDR family MFS transporter [Mycobacterium]|uniref:MFS transporter n=1 Tax=Mycobacterium paraffinicum TaxID=53378 RepID=A0ABP8F386_9MYCO|nr:MFS transporter [Mycobacterium intracellulare]ASX03455.1 MFS transporter [Mycobacterium intracellulare subsp. chimaera]PBA61239.1 MFS transporter [Mycobacterium intracellulare subsp. chimaera]
MKAFVEQFGSFERPARMLMINQFGINLGFYMLMPYLAAYLAGPLALAAWAVGLVLGVRNFSQQGMFVVGGTLADRIGYKPLIVAGCLLRTVGFALLIGAHSLPAVLIASAATGFAGALFNPAVRAYLAADAGDRRVEAFAVFNIFYQAGILLGPLLGVMLVAVDFRITAAAAAVIFAVLTVAQLLALPQQGTGRAPQKTSILDDWRVVLGNRSFLLFAVAMIGSYVLSFQVYLALPLQASLLTTRYQSLLVAGVFVVSGLVAVVGQLRITRWFAARWGRGRILAIGVAILAASFLPLTLVPDGQPYGTVPATVALLISAAMLAVGSAAVFPFEMDTVMALAKGRLVGTHYGFYNTIVGVGILAGNLATGWLMDTAQQLGLGEIIWAGLVFVGATAAVALYRLDRAHHLEAKATAETHAGQPVTDAYPASEVRWDRQVGVPPTNQCEAIQTSPGVEVSYARTG